MADDHTEVAVDTDPTVVVGGGVKFVSTFIERCYQCILLKLSTALFIPSLLH